MIGKVIYWLAFGIVLTIAFIIKWSAIIVIAVVGTALTFR